MKPDADVEPVAQVRNRTADEVSPLAAGLAVLCLMLLYFWLSDALFAEEFPGYRMSSAQVTGMALTYSTSPAFMIAALLYLQRRTRSLLGQLVDSGNLDAEALRGTGAAPIGRLENSTLTILGVVVGGVQFSWAPIEESLGQPTMWMVLSIAIGNIVTWIAVAHVLARRIYASLELRRLGREQAEVDLLRLDALLPFGRIATLHVLVVTIAVSLSALQSLDAELRWMNYSAALAAGIPAGVTLLLLPMLGIRANIRRAKRRALETLNAAIAHADRSLEPDALRYLGDLLRQREAIQEAREWPLDTTAFSRIAIYFVIPPIAWVCGAFVEILVQSAL